MLGRITIFVFLASLSAIFFFAHPVHAQGYLDHAQQMLGKTPKQHNSSGFGVDDASNVPVLDVDKEYPRAPAQPAYQPPRQSNGMPGCPDGSAPVMGLCGKDIPSPYR